jgi:trimethylamine:corrinoid methyltransferase-like protein
LSAISRHPTPLYRQAASRSYDILSEESLAAIEKTADRILAEIGIELRDDTESHATSTSSAGADVNRQGRRHLAHPLRARHAARNP